MGKILTEIAQQLKEAKGKVQLIYAFNGTGKTQHAFERSRRGANADRKGDC